MEALFGGKFDNRNYDPRGDNIPRILLRGWHPGTAAAAVGLNTDRGIYPFAWYHLLPALINGVSQEPVVAPPRLTDLSRSEVLALASAHIGVFFALGEYAVEGWDMAEPGHIAVVDLSRPYHIIHAPDLGWTSLPMEYLVHGPVTQGLRVVSIAAIRTTLNCQHWPFCHSVAREPHSVTEDEIRDSVRFGLLFQSAADEHVDVAIVLAASLLSWAQVPVGSPRPLGMADLQRAEQQQTRWPPADLDIILGSRLLVHNGVGPPLSGAVLANPLTSTEAWGSASSDTAGASQPRLTRDQWEAAFREAASLHTPVLHSCGPFSCRFCGGKTRAGATATDFSRPEFIYFCTMRCLNSQAEKDRVEGAAESP
ncbi:hypothetical protein F5883DRAFT_641970 [Diaporthe sp. PMI_573]|nr:hypothetical protein F5883DRAFT_641970 [Diaporthaceae sp. PMI_573]